MTKPGIFAVMVMLSAATPVYSHSVVDAHTGMVCKRSDYNKADDELDSIDSWHRLHDAYKRFKQCDDGALSEGYSDIVAQLLVRDWEKLKEAVKLSHADPAFKNWYISHLDETDNNDDLVKIEHLARTACPSGAEDLCTKIHIHFQSLECDPTFSEGVGCIAARD